MIDYLNLNRRGFLKGTAIGALGAMTAPAAVLTGCSAKDGSEKEIRLKDVSVPELLPKAPDGKPLTAGLIGCGGRGTGAATDFINAGNGLKITALGDVFEDKLIACRNYLKEKGQDIPDNKCFKGFDAYQKVIDSGVDVVLLCTPPVFRAEHFDYAVQKGKHCFIEKPCATDPLRAKQIIVSGKQATAKGLSVMSGTVRRSQRDCIENYRRVAGGMIGNIVSAHVTRLGGALWYVKRKPEWNDMEYMLRNWVNFCWTSGDLIVEQFIHEIDMLTWFMGDVHPVRAEATGGRQRRVNGDMYDFFSVEYVYEDGRRAHCTSRQIGGCDNSFGVYIYGTKGYTNCYDKIFNYDGSVAWQYTEPEGTKTNHLSAAYVQEHIRLVTAIRTGKPVNDTEQHVQSTLIAMMGRMSAYTGKFVSWDEIIASNMRLGPEKYAFGPVEGFSEAIPVAGKAPE